MKKGTGRMLALVLAAAMLFTVPGMAAYAQTEETAEGIPEQTQAGGAGAEEPAADAAEAPKGEQPPASGPEEAENTQDAALCAHHGEHTAECGYSEEENTPCGYQCRVCPVEERMAALPDTVTADNAEEVRAQLNDILNLYRELTGEEQGQVDISHCLALQAALDAANTPAPVEGEVSAAYREAAWNGSTVTYTDKTAGNCTSVESTTTAWTDGGWYVVNGAVAISEPVTLTGAVNLILADGCTLNAEKGIVVTTGNSLTIYAQPGGTGTLNATGTTDSNNNASAGIGSNVASVDSGTITIHGGIVNATGGSTGFAGFSGAGIGGAALSSGNGGSSGAITIYGGTITANSGAGGVAGAGIGGGGGGGAVGGSGSNITIYGGSVTAKSTDSGSGGAGIGGGGGLTGGGAGSNIQIYGGTVHATGGSKGAGIGGGGSGASSDQSLHKSGDGSVIISGGKVTAVGGGYAAGIGGGGGYYSSYTWGDTTYSNACTGGTGSVTITGGIVDATGGAGNASGNYAGAPIGNGGNTSAEGSVTRTAGIIFENGKGAVYGSVTLTEPLDVPEGYTLRYETGVFSGYAFYKDGKPVAVTSGEEVEGPFTVKKCEHDDVKPTPNNNGTHTLRCPYCGHTGTAENCIYGEYTSDATSHTQTCTACGYEKVEAHTAKYTATADGTVIAVREACETCGYETDLGTVTLHIPALVYGDLTGKISAETTLTEPVSVSVGVDGNSEKIILSPGSDGEAPAMADLTNNTLLSAGTHQLKVSIAIGSEPVIPECGLPFTVAPATLTESMVELSKAEFTYNGAEQKPAVTVRQGENLLEPGTDYDVSCTRNGADTTDFTSAGTVQIHVTGKGNYGGTVTKEFTITPAIPTVAWSAAAQELTYTGSPAGIAPPSVTLVKGEVFTGTIFYSHRKQGETADTDGLPTDAGAYTVKAHVDAQGSYTAADSTDELTLTIQKANAEITVGTPEYNVTWGDSAFSITGVADTNAEADVQYAVKGGTDVVSVSDGTVAILNAGTAEITVSLPESANYNAAESKTIAVHVAKKGYTAQEISKSSYHGKAHTETITLPFPENCGTVTCETPVTAGALTYSEAPAVRERILSYTVNAGSVGDTGTITVPVTTRNYADFTITVHITLTDRMSVALKEGTAVTLTDSALTYGEPLAKLTFNSGAVFVDESGNTVPGTLAWKNAAETPNVGTTAAVWVFTPAQEEYTPLEGTAAIQVRKAAPAVTAAPTVADRVYDPARKLEKGDLSGGAVTGVNGAPLPGTWDWRSAEHIPPVGNTSCQAVFTPEDTANYETAMAGVSVTVTKAVPHIAEPPAAAAITYGETLGDALLSGGSAVYGDGAGHAGRTERVDGTFAWKEPAAKPVAADSQRTEYTVVFTPADSTSYSAVETAVNLTVNKAPTAPRMPGSAMSVSNSVANVGSVPLPEGWAWQAGAQDTALTVGQAVNAVAIYTGADQGNYEQETVTVAITRSACEHAAGDILYTGAGEKAPTCTESGLGHRECGKCGEVVESGITVPALGHAYTGTVTTEPTADREGVRTYTCTRCGDSYTESIPKLPDSGGTGQPGIIVNPNPPEEPGDNGNTGDTEPDAELPFIKGEEHKSGWDVIRAEEEQAGAGSVINVDMNGAAVVPGDIFDNIRNRDITITFDMGGGIVWTVDGKSVTADKTGNIDFTVTTGGNTIPQEVVNSLPGGRRALRMHLTHEGAFGFTAVLSINVGRENAGYTASLYYYNAGAGRMEFVCADTVAADGRAALAFTHASDYVITVDRPEENGGGDTPPAEPTAPAEPAAPPAEPVKKSPQTSQPAALPWGAWTGVLMACAAMGGWTRHRTARRRGRDSTKPKR